MRSAGWLLAGALVLNAVGCFRDDPPEIPTFRVPIKPVIKNLPEPELASGAPQAPQPAPRPAPQPPKSVQVASAPAPEAPKPAAAAPAPAAPTIVGTWRVVEMAREGQTMPMPPGMNMMVTFTDSGTVSMAVSGGPGGGGQSQEGTYSVSGSQITISMRNDAKTGTLSFEGNDRAIIDVAGEVRMTLQRS